MKRLAERRKRRKPFQWKEGERLNPDRQWLEWKASTERILGRRPTASECSRLSPYLHLGYRMERPKPLGTRKRDVFVREVAELTAARRHVPYRAQLEGLYDRIRKSKMKDL